mgnify:CR=1 FL=1
MKMAIEFHYTTMSVLKLILLLICLGATTQMAVAVIPLPETPKTVNSGETIIFGQPIDLEGLFVLLGLMSRRSAQEGRGFYQRRYPVGL